MAENPSSPGDMVNEISIFLFFDLTLYGDRRVWGLFFAATLAMACCPMHVVNPKRGVWSLCLPNWDHRTMSS